METTAKTAQPQAATQMKVLSAPEGTAQTPQQVHEQHQLEHQHKASRVRGGGAGKDCFIGLFGCFMCFECCEGCCHCIGDIICCPCEMCC